MEKVRIDKWLWSVRIFKSRTMSSDACRSNKVKINGEIIKPSTAVVRGDLLEVKKNGFVLNFKVIDLLDKRVSATLAQPCYEDLTPAEELQKYQSWYIGKGQSERREKGAGRPTKRERREIDKYKDGF